MRDDGSRELRRGVVRRRVWRGCQTGTICNGRERSDFQRGKGICEVLVETQLGAEAGA